MNEIKTILKRNKAKADFDIDKIADAIYKAAKVLGENDYKLAKSLSTSVEDYLAKLERKRLEENKEIGRLYFRSIKFNITNTETLEYIKNTKFCMFLKRLLGIIKPAYNILLHISGFIGVLQLIKIVLEIFTGNHATNYRLQNSY